VNDKLLRMWKKLVVTYFKTLSTILLEGLRKTTEKTLVRLSGLLAKNLIQDLPNIK
jgi:hypothetical protein